MNPTLEIFSQGEEIVTGQILDTNANWLAQQAVKQGFTVTRHTVVGDKLDDLITLLREISKRANCCICTGGLGPTQDDLTGEAVAKAFNLPLEFDETAFGQIQQFFLHRNRAMPEANRKQAMLPQGALRIDNNLGTAPGFSIQLENCWFVFLPGVPSEMRPMFINKILPKLHQHFTLQPSSLITVKTFGLGESDIQQRMSTVNIPALVQLGFLASAQEVQTKLLFPYAYPEPAIRDLIGQILELFGDCVFAVNGLGNNSGDLGSVVNQTMSDSKKTLAIIETASQGLLASLFVGAQWLLEASYEHSLERLANKVAIPLYKEDLSETARQLASKLQKNCGADWVLVQLYEGGDNAFRNQTHAITVHTILLAGNEFHQSSQSIIGVIKRKQSQAAFLSLDLLRRYLQFGQYSHLSNKLNQSEIRKYGLRLLPKADKNISSDPIELNG